MMGRDDFFFLELLQTKRARDVGEATKVVGVASAARLFKDRFGERSFPPGKTAFLR